MSTTAFMMWSAYGMPISLERGDVRRGAELGVVPGQDAQRAGRPSRRRTSAPARSPTWWPGRSPSPGRATRRRRSWRSRRPTIEKITTTMLEKIAPTPCGRKPPCAVRLLKSKLWPGHRPRTNSAPSTRKTMIAATLMPANQYSNSPYERHREQVGRGHEHHQDQREQPQRGVDPVREDLRARRRPRSRPRSPRSTSRARPTEKPAQPPSASGRSRRRTRWTGSPWPSRRASASPG